MRKIKLVLLTAVILFSACEKEEAEPDVNDAKPAPVEVYN